MDENKIIYNKLCEKEFSIPIFSQAWWLNAVAGEKNWNIVMVKSNNEILATLPYYRKNLYGFTILTQPVFTQNLGPWLKTSEAKYSKMLSQQKNLLQKLYNQLPKFDYYKHNWHYSLTNWLPLYWHGFEASTRYTYVIEDLSDIDFIWGSLKENIRWDVLKAQNKIGISVRSDLPIDDFISLIQ